MAKKETKGKQGKPTKREAVREKRRQEQRRRRVLVVLGIVAAAAVIAAIVIVPSLLPAGDVVMITPEERPMADGTAPVTIEVFEDFQCPACKTYSEQIAPQVKDAYVATGEVYYIFRHYPFLDDNAPRKESDQAANASMCAADENRFWDYHDMLFANWNGENQGSFNDKRLIAFAEALDLDMAAFRPCFDDNLHAEVINNDLALGTELGVTGTPSVFVNGRLLTPGRVPSFTDISEAVEAELAQAGN